MVMMQTFELGPDNYRAIIVRADSPDKAIAKAIEFAQEREGSGVQDKGEFSFPFNDAVFVVRSDSDQTLLMRDWDRWSSGLIPPIEGRPSSIGPYPVAQPDARQLELE